MFFFQKPYSEGLKNRLLLEVLLEKAVISYRQLSTSLADTLSWYAAIGTIVGARLGHVVFYDWDHFRNYPMEIFKTWTGGLASHGGAIGVFATLFIFWRRNKQYFPNMSLLYLLDCVTLCSAFAACMIRLGNFWNQEILGIETSLPWAIVFGHPADGSLPCPRHPVQLYESFFYLLVFFSLWKLKKHFASEGLLSGIFFFSIFGFRFFIEFLKTPQGQFDSLFFLNMGQMLSIPFVFIGIYLIAKAIAKKSYTISK